MGAEVYARIGAAIRSQRDGVGLTQSALAERAGLKRTSITNIESGGQAITLGQLLDVAKALGVDAGRLIAEAETVEITPVRSPPNNPLATELLTQMSKPARAARG